MEKWSNFLIYIQKIQWITNEREIDGSEEKKHILMLKIWRDDMINKWEWKKKLELDEK